MKVQWTEKAVLSYEHIAVYILESFGVKAKNRFVEKVALKIRLVASIPSVGKLESTFGGEDVEYRSVIVNGLSKIIYRIEGNTLYVVAFWDTRREPKTLEKELE